MSTVNYQVIARKYRPKQLSQVIGQEPIVTTLRNALRFNRVAHAYLFCGCRGTGKTTLARIFAKALNCRSPLADGEPCNSCSCCTEINAGSSLDVIEIDGASNRGIEDVRQINDTVSYAPSSGHYKIYIVDEVHMLTKEAFNALLKTLEEPPPHVKFFFATTEPHKVLPTILSRCQRFDLRRINSQEIERSLSTIVQDLNVECEPEVLSLISSLADGSLRDAQSLLDRIICCMEPPLTLSKASEALGIAVHSTLSALDKAFEEERHAYAFELAADIFSSGKDISYFLDSLLEHYRQHLKLKLHSTVKDSIYSEEQCLYILEFLIKTQQNSPKATLKRVHLEMILLHILRSKHRLLLPQLIKRLEELEQQSKTPQPDPLERLDQHLAKIIPGPSSTNAPMPEPQASPGVRETLTQPPLLDLPPPSSTNAPMPQPQASPPVQDALPAPQCNYDTLIRFAAIELEGVLKNVSSIYLNR